MTDKKQDAHAELMNLVHKFGVALSSRWATGSSKAFDDVDNFARQLTDRITELEAQLEAVGAGGVGALIPKSGCPQEPFGYFKAEPFGWTDCAETDEGAIALYASPPPHQIAEPVSQWVSVAERLPIQDQEPYQVLSICKKRHGEDCNYPGQGIKRVSQDWVIRQWPQNFTHWMAIPILPATPKEPS